MKEHLYSRYLPEITKLLTHTDAQKISEQMAQYTAAKVEEYATDVITPKGQTNIPRLITQLLASVKIDGLCFVAPYISEYFINELIVPSPIPRIICLTNKNPPKYTKHALQTLVSLGKQKRKQVYIGLYKNKFLHVKMAIPFQYVMYQGEKIPSVPFVISGSMNFTQNGILRNEEVIFILKHPTTVQHCYQHFRQLWKHAKAFYP